MSLRTFVVLSALLSVFTIQHAQGQNYIPGPRFGDRAIEDVDNTAPFATPGVFDYDMQVFAPFELTSDEEIDPNCGYYLTLDKTLLNVSRSDRKGTSRVDTPIGNDWNWGERFQFGYMSEADSGWQVGWQQVDGAYYSQGAQDEDFRFIGFTADGSSTAGEALTGFGTRLLDLGDGSNLLNTQASEFGHSDSFSNQFNVGELNRVFRQQLKAGGYLEPYVGIRYTGVRDNSRQDQVLQFIGDDAQAPANLDQVGHRFRQEVSNSAFGFQAGARHNRRAGRWLLSADTALAGSYNQQRYNTSDIFFIDREREFLRENYLSNNSFVPTLDLELGASFNITRDITIRGGTQFMYLWDGIARVNSAPADLNPNSFASDPATRIQRYQSFPDSLVLEGPLPQTDLGTAGITNESYIAAGFTFGVEWRR